MNGLQSLETTLSHWQAKGAATDIARLAQSFARFEDLSVSQLCAILDSIQEDGSLSATRGRKSQTKKSEPDTQIVQSYVKALDDAGQQSVFDDVLRRLQKDKKVRLPEAVAIAEGYVGVELGLKKKTEAVEAIKQKRNRSGSLQERLERVREIF